MPVKRELPQVKEEGRDPKRAKTSATPKSRSATPIDSNPDFAVVYPNMPTPAAKAKLSKKEQSLIDAAEFVASPFISKRANKPGELDQHYTVTPTKEWASMKKYNNFIIQGETYTNKQFVFVRKEDTPKAKETEVSKLTDFWVARILQVRAKNAQHVYALVAWLYWPTEIPVPPGKNADLVNAKSGKRKYHGVNELVASNYLEVLDVLSFAGKADVFFWDEEDENVTQQLFWRQTYCRQTQALSKLKPHCICDGHYNPQVPMYICDNTSCKVWLHDECLVDDILTKTYKRLVEDQGINGVAAKKTKGRKPLGAKKYKNIFKATISANPDTPPSVTITDLRPKAATKTWTESIACPKCNTTLL